MKLFYILFFFLFTGSIVAQDFDIRKVISELNSKIEQSQKAEKLKWLDSLTLLIRDREEFKYDSIAQVTINYALSLDSIDIATRNTADLIYFKCNVVAAPDEGISIYQAFKKIENNSIELGNLFLYAGDCYSAKGNFKNAISSYKAAKIEFAKSKAKSREAVALLRISFAESDLGFFAEASQHIQQASKLFVEIKDTLNIVNSKNALSILYSQNAFYKEAKKERDEAIVLAKFIGGSPLVSLYYNAAADARLLKHNQDWIHYLKLALLENEKSEYKSRLKPNILNNLVIAYAVSDSISQAEKYLLEIESKPKEYTLGTNRDFYIEALKQLYFAKQNYKKAILYGKEHLQLKKEQESFVEIYNAEKFLADVYKAQGNQLASLTHLNNYYTIKDSISSVQNVRTLAYYQTIYETEKRDFKIEAQKADIQLLNVQNKVKNQWLLFGGLGLVFLFGGIMLQRSYIFAKKKQKMQELFSQNLINAQEEERTRVARDLHDSVGQKLMLLTKKTVHIGNQEMQTLANSTLDELRSISRGLHPSTIEKLGVTSAIKSLINEVDANTTIFFTTEIENLDSLINKETALHLYRIIQESLNNMIKHSQAKAASICIMKKDTNLVAEIKDNGKGFVFSDTFKNKVSLGMKTLLERAKIINSEIKINSDLIKGTSIQLIIPI
ncbi:MAG: histidine kinase [Flavobacteriales bacterium]